MEDFDTLEKLISSLRAEMVAAYEEKGNLTDENVVALSQALDIQLIKFQRLQTGQHSSENRR